MDAIKRTWDQISSVYQSMAFSQRLTLVAVTAMLLGSFGYLVLSGGDTEYVPLGYGKRFTMQELQAAQHAEQSVKARERSHEIEKLKFMFGQN